MKRIIRDIRAKELWTYIPPLNTSRLIHDILCEVHFNIGPIDFTKRSIDTVILSWLSRGLFPAISVDLARKR